MTRQRTRVLAAATAALLAVTGLAGCGGGDDAEAGALRLGYFPNITHAPALVGVENGTFAEHLGDEVTLTTHTFNAGGEAIEALFSGAVDATFVGPNPAINGWAQSQGQALHIIAGSTSGGAGLAVRPEITTVEACAAPRSPARRWATPRMSRCGTGWDSRATPPTSPAVVRSRSSR